MATWLVYHKATGTPIIGKQSSTKEKLKEECCRVPSPKSNACLQYENHTNILDHGHPFRWCTMLSGRCMNYLSLSHAICKIAVFILLISFVCYTNHSECNSWGAWYYNWRCWLLWHAYGACFKGRQKISDLLSCFAVASRW